MSESRGPHTALDADLREALDAGVHEALGAGVHEALDADVSSASLAALFAFGKHVLAQQPFSELVGAELVALTPGEAELRLPIGRDLTRQHGCVHGGVVSFMADNALTFAGGSVLGDVVKGEYKVNYLRPAVGEALVARARTIRAGKAQAVCECEIFAVQDGEEKLCAFSVGTINRRR